LKWQDSQSAGIRKSGGRRAKEEWTWRESDSSGRAESGRSWEEEEAGNAEQAQLAGAAPSSNLPRAARWRLGCVAAGRCAREQLDDLLVEEGAVARAQDDDILGRALLYALQLLQNRVDREVRVLHQCRPAAAPGLGHAIARWD
jgi:hypothetical protein